MVDAQIFLNVAEPASYGDYPPDRYVIDGQKLRAAAGTLRELAELGWTVCFAPHGYLDEGYVEWIVTKRFTSMDVARQEVAEVHTLQESDWRLEAAQNGLTAALRGDEQSGGEARAFRVSLGGPAPGGIREVHDPQLGPELEIPVGGPARRVLRVAATDAGGIGGSYIRVCDTAGNEHGMWSASRLGDDPERLVAEVLALVTGLPAGERPSTPA